MGLLRPRTPRGWLGLLAAAVVIPLLVVAAVITYGDAPRAGLSVLRASAPAPAADAQTSATVTGCPALPAMIRRDAAPLAFIADGALGTVDLSSCIQRTLLRHAVGPVRVSPDGRYIGSGAAVVTDRDGGQVQRPLGTGILLASNQHSWAWAPRGDGIAGITTAGAVIIGHPGASPRTLKPAGWHATSIAYADERDLVVVRDYSTLWSVPTDGASPHRIFRDPYRTGELQLADVLNGWAVVWNQPYLSASAMADGDLLIRVSLRTGMDFVIYDGVVVADGYVTPCGSGLAVLEGYGRDATGGKRIVVFDRRWRSRLVGSGVSPSCSADGRTIAYVQGHRNPDESFGSERRVVNVVHLGATGVKRLESRPDRGPGADDPILSPDGRVVEWAEADRRLPGGLTSSIGGTLRAATTTPPVHVTGPLLSLGRTTDFYGTLYWPETVAPFPVN